MWLQNKRCIACRKHLVVVLLDAWLLLFAALTGQSASHLLHVVKKFSCTFITKSLY